MGISFGFHSDAVLREILHELRSIHHQLNRLIPHDIESFNIEQQGDFSMALIPIAPGFSPVFTATPVPAGTFPNPSNPPTWTSSDPNQVLVTVDPTGLVATVAISTTATVGASVTLSISYTNADGTVASGSLSITIVAAPSPDITSFTIAQTS